MDFLSADSLPWLRRPRQWLAEARTAGRLPQSVLLLSAPGLGAVPLAYWMAALALCDAPTLRACGECASCALLRADSHPDLHVVQLEEDAKQIKVDQIRDLISTLTLTSYRRGHKVGIIETAEALNASGANAFLKTLEEPSANTLLILIAKPAHRLPATIASRCVHLKLRPPPEEEALAWLDAQGKPATPWRPALSLAGGAPLGALEFNPGAVAALDSDMHADMGSLAAGAVDVTLMAERWVKSDLSLRLRWLENWITRRVRAHLAGGDSTQSAERVRLPAPLLKPKIRSLFALLDGARSLERLASTGINQQLALEALLLGGRTAWAT